MPRKPRLSIPGTLHHVMAQGIAKKGWTIQTVAEQVAAHMKIDIKELLQRGRQNDRSMMLKVVAALVHIECEIPIIEIARFYGVASSSVARMLEDGAKYTVENSIELRH